MGEGDQVVSDSFSNTSLGLLMDHLDNWEETATHTFYTKPNCHL